MRRNRTPRELRGQPYRRLLWLARAIHARQESRGSGSAADVGHYMALAPYAGAVSVIIGRRCWTCGEYFAHHHARAGVPGRELVEQHRDGENCGRGTGLEVYTSDFPLVARWCAGPKGETR